MSEWKSAWNTCAPPQGAQITLDGVYVGKASLRQLELQPGEHTLAVSKNGKVPVRRTFVVAPDQDLALDVSLVATRQRHWATGMLGLSGAALVTGGIFSGLAIHEQKEARAINRRRGDVGISVAELDSYEAGLRRRDNFRAAAVGGFSGGVALALTGLLMFAFDRPSSNSLSVFDSPARGAGGPSKGVELSLLPWSGSKGSGGTLSGRF